MILHDLWQQFIEEEFVAADLIDALQSLSDEGWLHQRAHVWPKGLQGWTRLQDVRDALGKHLLPENHMAYKTVVLLLPEQAAHVALGKLDLAKCAEDEYVETCVPEPLELIALFRWHDVAIVGPKKRRVSFLHIVEHDSSDPVFELVWLHRAGPCMAKMMVCGRFIGA